MRLAEYLKERNDNHRYAVIDKKTSSSSENKVSTLVGGKRKKRGTENSQEAAPK